MFTWKIRSLEWFKHPLFCLIVLCSFVKINLLFRIMDPLKRKSPSSTYGKCSKILNTFLFLVSNKLLLFMAGYHKMLVRTANTENPDQTASSEAVWSGFAMFVLAFLVGTSVRNLRTLTVCLYCQQYESRSDCSCLVRSCLISFILFASMIKLGWSAFEHFQLML